jgi:hypothetical protein
MSSVARAVVRHTKLVRKSVAAGLAKLDAVCAAGAQCAAVLASPMCSLALQALQTAVDAARAALTAMLDALTECRASAKALVTDFAKTDASLRLYERVVDGLAGGDAAIITAAGLPARDVRTPPAALGAVTKVLGKPGKLPGQAILAWPPVKGATVYALEVSFTVDSLDGPWTAPVILRRRRLRVTAPAPGAQLLARVAAVDAYGTQSDWSPPILVTAR